MIRSYEKQSISITVGVKHNIIRPQIAMGQHIKFVVVTLNGIATFLENWRLQMGQLNANWVHTRFILKNVEAAGYGVLEKNTVLFRTVQADVWLQK